MTVYTDTEGRIKDVNTTSDTSLIPQEITDGTFDGWTTAKICCYKVAVKDGNVNMLTPYVDSRLIEHIDMLGREVEKVTPYKQTKTAYIDDTEITFENVPTGNLSVFSTVSEYNVNRDGETVIIDFAPLEEVTEFTIMIQ